MTTVKIEALHRYPVKGLSPQPVEAATLETGGYFPGDRLYAIENGDSGFDPERPVHEPKIKYLMLMRNERLAELSTRYDDFSRELVVSRNDEILERGNLGSVEGRQRIDAFFEGFCRDELRGPARLLAVPDAQMARFRFVDSGKSGFVSLINLASVEDLARQMGVGVDPLRFRGNLHVSGLSAWSEAGLVGSVLSIGAARFEVLKPIERCAATAVDPHNGRRDLDIVGALRRLRGDVDCGIYLRVLAGGTIKVGDAIGFG